MVPTCTGYGTQLLPIGGGRKGERDSQKVRVLEESPDDAEMENESDDDDIVPRVNPEKTKATI